MAIKPAILRDQEGSLENRRHLPQRYEGAAFRAHLGDHAAVTGVDGGRLAQGKDGQVFRAGASIAVTRAKPGREKDGVYPGHDHAAQDDRLHSFRRSPCQSRRLNSSRSFMRRE